MKQNNMQDVIEQLNLIFCDVFDDDTIKLSPETTANDIDGWDSLSHIRLIVSIEKVLSLRFSAAEISNLPNVGELAGIVMKKLT